MSIRKTLLFFDKVTLTREALETPLGNRLAGLLKNEPERSPDAISFTLGGSTGGTKRELLVKLRPGPFLKSCPGTPRYLCCGYRVLAWAEGCPLSCSYCVLSGYFQHDRIILFANTGDLLDEVDSAVSKSRRFLRLGTGEFTDSLLLEPLAGLHKELIPVIARSQNAVLEVKTKTIDIDPLLSLDHGGRTIAAWSLNAPAAAGTHEAGMPTVEERIAASSRASSAGYPVAFHFDPLIHHDSWETGYSEVAEMMKDYLGDTMPVWISLGCLRFPPAMLKSPRGRSRCGELLRDEFHPGDDGKMRYLRPLRVSMYRHVAGLMRRLFPESALYLCMESRDVWKESMGWAPSGSAEVARLLDRAAAGAVDRHRPP